MTTEQTHDSRQRGIEIRELPRHPSPSTAHLVEASVEEGALATIIQEKQRGTDDRHQRWERLERVALCAQYGDLHAQGLSQRHAAQGLTVPRSTLQAWRADPENLDACPAGVAFFHRVAGLAFLPRRVLA
jgi:hypothetical protein